MFTLCAIPLLFGFLPMDTFSYAACIMAVYIVQSVLISILGSTRHGILRTFMNKRDVQLWCLTSIMATVALASLYVVYGSYAHPYAIAYISIVPLIPCARMHCNICLHEFYIVVFSINIMGALILGTGSIASLVIYGSGYFGLTLVCSIIAMCVYWYLLVVDNFSCDYTKQVEWYVAYNRQGRIVN